MKESKLMTFKMENVRQDRTFQHTYQNNENSALFAKAVERFKHYTYPVGYVKDEYAYVLGQMPSLNALIEMEQDEETIEIINIREEAIVPFIFAFLPKEHLQPRSLVALVKLIMEYAKTEEGKTWFKSVCDSQKTHFRLANILDTSTYVTNACLHLLKSDNGKFLRMLNEPDVSLTKAYNESIKQAKDQKEETGSSAKCSTGTSNGPAQYRSAGTHVTEEPSNTESGNSETNTSAVQTPAKAGNSGYNPFSSENDQYSSNPEKWGASEVENDAFPKQLESYRKENSIASQAHEKDLVLKVIVALYDNTELELLGKIVLIVDSTPIRSTEQLVKGSDGKWRLPKHSAPVSLIVHTEETMSQAAEKV